VVMEWAHLRGIPSVCALAGGELKLRVLFTLLVCDLLSKRGTGLIKELVTDSTTAAHLISGLSDFERAPREVKEWYQAIAPTIFESTTKTNVGGA
jgi:hypothetical protein